MIKVQYLHDIFLYVLFCATKTEELNCYFLNKSIDKLNHLVAEFCSILCLHLQTLELKRVSKKMN